eukprot:TRINITY_DN8453_c0_g1_i5.p1 TRINITY_DN8453_c0_g1~~TRINITY_DN8453_c0_g1_i5.p1  ORF type:complete len:685 (-),score=87.18 TRINITY_DN8453_c0_g1_i5:1192-3138(-)
MTSKTRKLARNDQSIANNQPDTELEAVKQPPQVVEVDLANDLPSQQAIETLQRRTVQTINTNIDHAFKLSVQQHQPQTELILLMQENGNLQEQVSKQMEAMQQMEQMFSQQVQGIYSIWQDRVDLLQGRIDELNGMCNQQNVVMNQLAAESQQEHEQSEQLRQQLQESQTQHECDAQKILDLQTRNNGLELDTQDLHLKVQELEQSLQKANQVHTDNQQLRFNLSQLEVQLKQLSEIQTENKQLKLRNTDLEEQLKHLNQFQEENQQLKVRITTMQEQQRKLEILPQMELENKQLREHVSKLQEYQRQSDKMAEISTENTQLKVRVRELEGQLKQLDRLEELQVQNIQLNQQISQQAEQMQSMKELNDDLFSKLQVLEEENERFKAQTNKELANSVTNRNYKIRLQTKSLQSDSFRKTHGSPQPVEHYEVHQQQHQPEQHIQDQHDTHDQHQEEDNSSNKGSSNKENAPDQSHNILIITDSDLHTQEKQQLQQFDHFENLGSGREVSMRVKDVNDLHFEVENLMSSDHEVVNNLDNILDMDFDMDMHQESSVPQERRKSFIEENVGNFADFESEVIDCLTSRFVQKDLGLEFTITAIPPYDDGQFKMEWVERGTIVPRFLEHTVQFGKDMIDKFAWQLKEHISPYLRS